MAKYLVKANYTAPYGVRGLISDGGTARVTAVKALAAAVGGTVESFYYAFGDVDVYVILDLPDTTSALAASLAVNASGLTSCEAIVLITPEEVDAAVKKIPGYNAPGPSA